MLRALLVGVVAVASWLIASWSCHSISERVYWTIPPVALAWFLTRCTPGHLRRLRPLLALLAAFLVLSVAVASIFLGPKAVLSWRFWLEAATCLYFITAAILILVGLRRVLLKGTHYLHERWQFSPGVRMIVCEVAPLVLLLTFALPYAMAFSNVHRFKMPNFRNPKDAWGRPFEEVEFRAADGTTIRGWWIPAKGLTSSASATGRAEKCPRTLVFCHGIAGNRSVFLPFVEAADWLDANILMFDLRGHGDSDGRTVTLGYWEKEDVLAAIAFVRREKPDEAREVIGMGVSLGAATLAEAAALVEPPLDGVILDSAFTSTQDMTHAVVKNFPPACHPWLLTLGLPMAEWHAGCPMMDVRPESSVARLRAPVLLLHSRGDPLIPSEHAHRLLAQAAEPKRLCIFELPGHCDAFFAQRERYRDEVVAFGARVGSRER